MEIEMKFMMKIMQSRFSLALLPDHCKASSLGALVYRTTTQKQQCKVLDEFSDRDLYLII